jgi:gliding motility-associated lipoprotein GldB
MHLNTLQRNQNYLIYGIVVLLAGLFSCKEPAGHSASVQLTVKRFEKDLFSIDQNNYNASLDSLQQEYPAFYPIYFSRIVGFGQVKDSTYRIITRDFINNADLKMLYHDCDSIYANFDGISRNLSLAFGRYQALFPEDTIPEIITFISGFNNGVVTGEGFVGIGLDMFLGEDYRFYPSVNIPRFIVRRMNSDHLVPTVMQGVISAKYETENGTAQTLLDQMIEHGKRLYFLDQVLPDTHDSLKIGYSAAQLKWCKQNETNIWGLFLEENVLYSADQLKFSKYIDEAPFTAGLNNDSAPRIGVWAGWQIVKKYMKENPDITLQQLMETTDSQLILKKSKYRP